MDRENVMSFLKGLAEPDWRDFHSDSEVQNIAKSALALLKEQEAVEPYQHDAVWLCGNCTKEVVGWIDDITGEDIRYPFCRQCGRPVKWE